MSRKVFDDFDGFADNYRQIHNEGIKISGAESDYFSEQKIEEVRRNEEGNSPQILDLGCGDGNSAAFFRKHFDKCTYFGLDTSKASVSVANGRRSEAASFVHYDGLNVPFADNTFDIVFIACVLHHVEPQQHENILSDVKRVLKPGGRLYIFEHNPFNPVTRRIVNKCPFDEDAILLTSNLTRSILQKVSFRKVEIAYTIFFPRHRIFQSLLPIERFLTWLPLGGQYYARAVKGLDAENV
jgi:ubiquinone/menaquinone biosynthesis C-methylase UbiE